jgi:hypothetical protein
MKTKVTAVTLVILNLICISLASAQRGLDMPKQPQKIDETALMSGKIKTDHSILLDITVEAPPSDVFRLWTTANGIKKFFAPDGCATYLWVLDISQPHAFPRTPPSDH